MKKALIIASALLTMIIALVFFYFKDTIKKDGGDSLFALISTSNGLVIEFNYEEDLITLFKESNNSTFLLNESYLKELRSFHQLLQANNKVYESVNANKILIAFKQLKLNQIGATYLMNVNPKELDDLSSLFISKESTLEKPQKRNFENSTIWELTISKDSVLAYALIDDNLILSLHPQLVEESIRAYQSKNNLQNQEIFRKLQAQNISNARNVASIYINFASFTDYLKGFLIPKQYAIFFNVNGLAAYSCLHLNYKSDAWILNGQTNYEDKHFYSVFDGQQPATSYLRAFIPNTTLAFNDYIFSDYTLFRTQLKKYMALQKDFSLDAELNLATKKYNHNIDELIKKHAGVEYLYMFSNNLKVESNATISMMQLKKADEFQQLIQKINSVQKKNKILKYKGLDVGNFPYRKWMYFCVGLPFKQFNASYYCIIEDRLILSDSEQELMGYIDSYTSSQLLSNNQHFQEFTSALSNQYNYLCYLDINSHVNALSEILNDDSKLKLMSHNGWQNYDGFAFQLSAEQKNLISNIYMPLKLKVSNSVNLAWKYELPLSTSNPAYFVINSTTKIPEVLVQDDSNHLHLIEFNSKLRWKIKLSEKIISRIYEVDYYKNGSSQFLFNSERFLYLVNEDGKLMPNYPIRLSTKASCGLSLFDYEGNKNYRIFITCDNQTVNGYELNGRPLEGWNPKKIALINEPIQHIKVNNKDLLFMHSNDGRFFFYNRKGELQSQFKDSANVHYYNPFTFVSDSTFANSRFVSTDQNGKIKSIFIDGHRMYKTVGNWSNRHFFNYANVSGDIKKEYIFLDNNQLIVYQDDTSIVFNYEFKSGITDAPFLIPIDESSSLLGVISSETNQIYLFDRNGLLLPDFPISGAQKPDIIKYQDKTWMVLTGSDKGVYLYEIQL